MISGTQNITVKRGFQIKVWAFICHGFGKTIRLPALIFDIPFCSFSRKISIKEQQAIVETLEAGDILLSSDKLFPTWQFAVKLIGSSHYSHAALYKGENCVIEATTFHPSGMGVAQTVLHDFLSGRKSICVVRPAYPSEHKKNAMLTWLEEQLGKSYDYSFESNGEHTMYCAKLVAKALFTAGLSTETKRFLKRNIYLPDTFLRVAGIKTVYCNRETGRRKFICYLPTIAVIPAFLTIPTVSMILCIIGILLLLIITGWLQHLKMI